MPNSKSRSSHTKHMPVLLYTRACSQARGLALSASPASSQKLARPPHTTASSTSHIHALKLA